MVWHLITYAMMLSWLPMYMIMKLEVQKIGIYMCQNVTKNFANAVLCIKEVHSGMTYPTKLKNLVPLKVLNLIIVSTLDRVSPHIQLIFIVFSYQVLLNMTFLYSINLPMDILNSMHVFSPSVKCTK